MSSDARAIERLPPSTWIVPAVACAWLTAKLAGLLPAAASVVVIVSTILLFAAVFASVHHAEVIALKVGEPFGTLVLALAVTVIEGSLIVSVMFSGGAESSELARDTVFATVMIVCNGVLGLSLLVGGLRHRVVSFKPEGTTPAVAVLATLATLTLVLPQFTLASDGPTYSSSQLAFAGIVSLLLYAVFIFVQTVRHRGYFLPEDAGAEEEHATPPTLRAALLSLGLLLVGLVAVVGLAKVLAPTIEGAVDSADMPRAVVGIAIAMMVLLPESMSALRAARRGRLQTSMNLGLGSALATIGLTIPAVAVASIALGLPLTLGLPPTEMVLLGLTLLLTAMTVLPGRATILQGAVHLVVFAVFLFLAMVP
ncbi:ionic transporter y4hA [Wenzhouxiangella sp. XN24]|uniref:calcium:proton antiporter n=1 Tax=Wenzhouxiangella sp. XN24 TaxID=2713569 RepID=UPI00197D893E|nr:ionic transporter y4hA [Wenzhouxiangella sp. XN24]